MAYLPVRRAFGSSGWQRGLRQRRHLRGLAADAVWGNVGSIVAFRVGSDDAEMIAQQLGKYPGQITPENLSGLPKYAAYARLPIDGMPSNPLSLQTLPPRRESFDPERAEIIRRIGRRRFPQGNQARV